MEFSSRGNGNRVQPQVPVADHGQQQVRPGRRKHIDWAARTIRIEIFVLLLGMAFLLAGVSLYVALGSSNVGSEAKKVDTTKYQAIFLNGGATSGSVSYSTYFGHITKINDKYFVLNNIYYLTDQQTQNGQASSPQLTKLGCQQLHSPYDQMIINRNQIAFWENLKDDGKVVKAIKQFQEQNPKGPDCTQQPQSQSSSDSSAQNSTSTQQSSTTKATTPPAAPVTPPATKTTP